MNNSAINISGGRLALLYFLQFAVWGCYLTCLGQFLGRAGLGSDISWFYSAAGLVSLFMPAFAGYLADKKTDATRLLVLFHLLAACFMAAAWWYSCHAPQVEFRVIFCLYFLFLCFYMPTIPLANTVTFSLLSRSAKDAASAFPAIRMFGTIGFVAAMWFVNCAYYHDGVFGFTFTDAGAAAANRFQYTDKMLLCSAVAGLLTAFYALTLPASGIGGKAGDGGSLRKFFADNFKLLGDRSIRIFLIFAVLAGVCVQITNGYATPFITHFMADKEYAGSLVASNATFLFSLSQISEAACLLLIPVCMRRFGVRWVIAIALVAWALRFGFFGFGNPGSGLWMLVGSMLVYGVAFDFFSIAGQIYMEQKAGDRYRGRAQGLLMMTGSGIGATLGMIWAGAVVNGFCHWEKSGAGAYFMGDWRSVWLIFAAYALALAVGFVLATSHKNNSRRF